MIVLGHVAGISQLCTAPRFRENPVCGLIERMMNTIFDLILCLCHWRNGRLYVSCFFSCVFVCQCVGLMCQFVGCACLSIVCQLLFVGCLSVGVRPSVVCQLFVYLIVYLSAFLFMNSSNSYQ